VLPGTLAKCSLEGDLQPKTPWGIFWKGSESDGIEMTESSAPSKYRVLVLLQQRKSTTVTNGNGIKIVLLTLKKLF